MLSFEQPSAFLFLFAIPFCYLLYKLGVFSPPVFFLCLADWQGTAFEWKNPLSSFARFVVKLFFICGYIALIISLAEPVFLMQEKRFTSRGAEVIFVVDTSPSMAALDIAGGKRLDAAKQAISLLVKENTGSAYGLVSAGTEAALLVPPTMDQETFFSRLQTMEIGEMGDGTALGLGIGTAVYHLVSSSSPAKLIVLLTDGENNAGSIHPKTAAALAKDHNISLYIAGIGTRGSVPIEYTDPVSGKVYSGYLDSGFDDSYLRTLALAGGGLYYTIETLPALSAALENINLRHRVNQSYYIRQNKRSLYVPCLLASAALFCFAWIVSRWYLQEIV